MRKLAMPQIAGMHQLSKQIKTLSIACWNCRDNNKNGWSCRANVLWMLCSKTSRRFWAAVQ